MQLEWRRGNYQQLEGLFAEALRPHGNVRMWRLYLQYVARSSNTSTGEGSPSVATTAATTGTADPSMVTRQTMVRAYELALSHVGLDLHSASLYADYISFISQWTVQERTNIENVFLIASPSPSLLSPPPPLPLIQCRRVVCMRSNKRWTKCEEFIIEPWVRP